MLAVCMHLSETFCPGISPSLSLFLPLFLPDTLSLFHSTVSDYSSLEWIAPSSQTAPSFLKYFFIVGVLIANFETMPAAHYFHRKVPDTHVLRRAECQVIGVFSREFSTLRSPTFPRHACGYTCRQEASTSSKDKKRDKRLAQQELRGNSCFSHLRNYATSIAPGMI